MNNISINISECPQNKEINLLRVTGFIDTTTVSEFERIFLSVLKEKKFKLVVDLKGVNYISSAGWGLFVSEIKHIRDQEGDLVLTGMNPEVMEVFELLGFNFILKFFPDPETAFKHAFQTPPPPAKKGLASLLANRGKGLK